ncbi:HesA/MoeB/ThiF family protein [Deferribacter thermophilus]|uniref:HesA/MoeB/ThiF family protein n=1 Tax=Deferribacter thermophilus TaxID=53573 RepID=UPI003C269280
MFNEKDIERYSRHIILQEIGVEGQIKICESKVLIIGAGGLGSPVALYLAAAGVGTIGIVDMDNVELSNLQRQIIHFTDDVGKPKVESAAEKIKKLNPNVKVETYNEKITSKNILELVSRYDFVVDGTDNFASKFLINDACIFAKKPFSHGGILRFIGQTLTVIPGESACYRCVFKFPPPPDAVPTCASAGILGAIAGMLGTIQAAEVLKYITGVGNLLTNRILYFDSKDMTFRNINIKKNEKCPVCGNNPTIKELKDEEEIVCELKR